MDALAIPTHVPQLWRLPVVSAVTGYKRSSIYALMKQDKFPKPVRLSGGAVAWRSREVIAWVEAQGQEAA